MSTGPSVGLGMPAAPPPPWRRDARPVSSWSATSGGQRPPIRCSRCAPPNHDVNSTLQQIAELTAAGCDIVRVACPRQEDADALAEIARHSQIPVIADIHFQPKYIFAAIDAGCAAVRNQPGNIKEFDGRVAEVAKAAGAAGILIRIGVNAGSLDKRFLEKYGKATPEALVESALWEASLFEEHGFGDIKISVKHNDLVVMVSAYQMLAEKCDYPLHLERHRGRTGFQGTIKSAVAFGALLSGVSATPSGVAVGSAGRGGQGRQPDPGIAEPPAARAGDRVLPVLRAGTGRCLHPGQCGYRRSGGAWTSRPGGGHGMCRQRAGEAREADLGVASGGQRQGQIFVKGEVIKTVPESQIVETLIEEAMRLAEEMGGSTRLRVVPGGHRKLTGHPTRGSNPQKEHRHVGSVTVPPGRWTAHLPARDAAAVARVLSADPSAAAWSPPGSPTTVPTPLPSVASCGRGVMSRTRCATPGQPHSAGEAGPMSGCSPRRRWSRTRRCSFTGRLRRPGAADVGPLAAGLGPARDVRDHQPLMAPAVAPAASPLTGRAPRAGRRAGRLSVAAVDMFIGRSASTPGSGDGGRGYRRRVAGRSPPDGPSPGSSAAGWCSRPKSGSQSPRVGQIQAWVHPEWRGRGLAPRAPRRWRPRSCRAAVSPASTSTATTPWSGAYRRVGLRGRDLRNRPAGLIAPNVPAPAGVSAETPGPSCRPCTLANGLRCASTPSGSRTHNISPNDNFHLKNHKVTGLLLAAVTAGGTMSACTPARTVPPRPPSSSSPISVAATPAPPPSSATARPRRTKRSTRRGRGCRRPTWTPRSSVRAIPRTPEV